MERLSMVDPPSADTKPAEPKSRSELVPGTLEMLILKTLMQGTLHGYGIAQRIRDASQDVLHVEEGSLYQIGRAHV